MRASCGRTGSGLRQTELLEFLPCASTQPPPPALGPQFTTLVARSRRDAVANSGWKGAALGAAVGVYEPRYVNKHKHEHVYKQLCL